MNRVYLKKANPALKSLIENPGQVILLDANALLAPDRSKENSKIPSISFDVFRDEWLEPILSAFPQIAIHEAVLTEIITAVERTYVDTQLNSDPPRLRLLSDATLTPREEILRSTIESRIAVHTAYDPVLDKGDDRGEVKTLAYMATQGFLYFCSRDSKALRLIEQAEKLNTNLDAQAAVRFYEVLYYLCKKEIGNQKMMKMLYKYLYNLTKAEKGSNPDWLGFIAVMDKLYQ